LKNCENLLNILNNHNLVTELKNNKNFNLEYLTTHHNITEPDLDNLLKYAKFIYECGKYQEAAIYLGAFRLLSKNPVTNISALWGKCACDIICSSWGEALEDIQLLKEFIDNPKGGLNAQQQLHQRSWLLNWGLFVYFKQPNGMNLLVEFFLSDNRYKQAIQNGCPWIIRYVVAVVIGSKSSDEFLKETIKMVSQEEYQYSDSLTRYIMSLFVEFNYEESYNILKDISELLSEDYFISTSDSNSILTHARELIYEYFCLVHTTLDLTLLAKNLETNLDGAEKFVVGVITKHNLSGKRENNNYKIEKKINSQYQQLIDKTKQILKQQKTVTTTNTQTTQ